MTHFTSKGDMMTFTRLFSSLLASALLASTLHAWTSSFLAQGTPQCDDKEVQDLVKDAYLDFYLKRSGITDIKLHSDKAVSEYGEKAEQIFRTKLKLTMDSFGTVLTDEEKKLVGCNAEISKDMQDNDIRDAFELMFKAVAAKTLGKNEILTDKKFDDFIKRQFSSRSKYEKELDKQVEKADKELHGPVLYDARRTDDGKLIVEIDDLRE